MHHELTKMVSDTIRSIKDISNKRDKFIFNALEGGVLVAMTAHNLSSRLFNNALII